MKKILIALSFALAAASASANTISGALELVGSDTPVAINPSDAGWGPIGSLPEGSYIEGLAGSLYATADGVFTATYLGQVAALGNFYLGTGRLDSFNTGGTPGDSVSMSVSAGQLIPFSFGQDDCGFAPCNGIPNLHNGMVNQAFQGMLFFANTFNLTDGSGRLFDFLIGYNDTASVNDDYDDMVVGVVNHVPVPAALPLMASALGAFGLSRRKSKTTV